MQLHHSVFSLFLSLTAVCGGFASEAKPELLVDLPVSGNVTPIVVTSKSAVKLPLSRPLVVSVVGATDPVQAVAAREELVNEQAVITPTIVPSTILTAASAVPAQPVVVPTPASLSSIGAFLLEGDILVFDPLLSGEKEVYLPKGTENYRIGSLSASFIAGSGKEPAHVELVAGSTSATFTFYDFVVQLEPQGRFSVIEDPSVVVGHRFSVSGGTIQPVNAPTDEAAAVAAMHVDAQRLVHPVVEESGADDSRSTTVADLLRGDAPLARSPRDLAVEELHKLPKRPLHFRHTPIRRAFMRMATLSGISYHVESLPNTGVRVDADLYENPFRAMEQLAAKYKFQIDYVDGTFSFSPMGEEGLIARTYKLRFNYLTEVSRVGGSSSSSGATAPSAPGGGNSSMPVTLSQSTAAFSTKGKQLEDDIRRIINNTSVGVVVKDSSSKDSTDDGLAVPHSQPVAVAQDGKEKKERSLASDVFFNAIHGELYVMCSRQQHEWVRGYLRTMDRPQRMVGVQLKFVETTDNPIEKIGLALPDAISGQFAMPSRYRVFGDASTVLTGGTTTSVNGTPVTTGGEAGPTQSAFGVVLNANQMSAALNMLKTDSKTKSIYYASKAGLESTEIILRNLTQEPISQGNSTATGGAVQNSSTVQYLPVGTSVNVLPQIRDETGIRMDLLVSISDFLGFKTVNGTEVPRVNTRDYNSTVSVPNGYSIAIAGLERERLSNESRKVPLLGSIPGVGRLFESKGSQTERTHLLIFVTPLILSEYSTGVDSIGHATSLGREKRERFVPGLASNSQELRYQADGIGRQIDGFYTKMEENQLGKGSLATVLELRKDISGMVRELDTFLAKSTDVAGSELRVNLEAQLRRVDYLVRYLTLTTKK